MHIRDIVTVAFFYIKSCQYDGCEAWQAGKWNEFSPTVRAHWTIRLKINCRFSFSLEREGKQMKLWEHWFGYKVYE